MMSETEIINIERVLRKWADPDDTDGINEMSPEEVARKIQAVLAERTSPAESAQPSELTADIDYDSPLSKKAMRAFSNAMTEKWHNVPGGCWHGVKAALAVARAEIEKEWRSWGIVEIATRNQSVSDYVNHWEKRATEAESEVQQLQQKLRERDKEWEQAIGLVWEVFPEHQWTLGSFVSECRARLGRKKERVEVGATGGHWIVYDNGVEVFHLSRTSYTKQDAERYAAGLRAEIGEEK